MQTRQRYTVDQVIDAIKAGHTPKGAAAVLGCCPDTVRNYAVRYQSVKKALDTERQDIVDIAESGLRAAVERGEAWAVAFALKTLAKDIYSERQEVTGANGDTLVVTTRIVKRNDAAS
jgi:hypothetical protein